MSGRPGRVGSARAAAPYLTAEQVESFRAHLDQVHGAVRAQADGLITRLAALDGFPDAGLSILNNWVHALSDVARASEAFVNDLRGTPSRTIQ